MAMTRDEITAKVQEILLDEFNLGPVKLHAGAQLTDLGLDSIDRVELSFDIEEEFGLESLDEVYMGWRTVGEIVDYIDSALSAG